MSSKSDVRGRLITGTAIIVMLTAVGFASAADQPPTSYFNQTAIKATADRHKAAAALGSDRPAASFYTPAALKAMGERYKAMTRFYTQRKNASGGSAASHYTPAALKAMGERYQAAATFYQQRQLRQAEQRASAFHWRDAIIGGGVALALVALTLVGVRVLAHGQRPTPAPLS